MELIFHKDFKSYVTFIGEISEFELEVVPVVEGEGKCVYFFVEIEPFEG